MSDEAQAPQSELEKIQFAFPGFEVVETQTEHSLEWRLRDPEDGFQYGGIVRWLDQEPILGALDREIADLQKDLRAVLRKAMTVDPPKAKPKYEVVVRAAELHWGKWKLHAKVGDLVRSRYSNRSTGAVWRVEKTGEGFNGAPILSTVSLTSKRRNEQFAGDMEIVREVQ